MAAEPEKYPVATAAHRRWEKKRDAAVRVEAFLDVYERMSAAATIASVAAPGGGTEVLRTADLRTLIAAVLA